MVLEIALDGLRIHLDEASMCIKIKDANEVWYYLEACYKNDEWGRKFYTKIAEMILEMVREKLESIKGEKR